MGSKSSDIAILQSLKTGICLLVQLCQPARHTADYFVVAI
jgi:hypothetical protein